ncbi:MAG: Stp1/IreP family PP2C-type Ser/Thr phosphatase [Oscillospiraceae bacterium]|nr:Stp1/IreP family PP2C-type Ser/Thr phosphatase [Oscillospiraceae bacterium]
MEIWGATDRGMVRKQNQDTFRWTKLNDSQFLAVVCDGMGGAKSGDVASKLASEVFEADISQSVEPDMDQQSIVKMLVDGVKSANRAVYEQSLVSPDFKGMGTTLVAVFLQGSAAYIINVGDSRCYYLSEGEVSQVTEDHSVVGLMVARGQISEEEARTHPNKNLITRAVGTEPDVECDCFYLGLDQGEYLLLCSDGLSNMVSRPEMLFEITHGENGTQCCQRLIDIAKNRGAPDNVTVVLMKYE